LDVNERLVAAFPYTSGLGGSYVMADESQSEAIGREVRTLSNKQVELYDRLRDVEERLDMLLERIKKIEDTIKVPTRKR
jgi:hypothetical protein